MSNAFRKDVLELAERLGWSVTRTSSSHLRFKHPQVPAYVFGASSPRKPHRALANVKGDLMRAMRKHNVPIPEE